MSARSSMAELIARVRLLINDPNATVFTDDQVQDSLDRYRLVARYAPLRAEPTFMAGGIIHYLDYFADLGDWESNVILSDNSFFPIQNYPTGTLVTSDFLTGHWTFQDNPNASPTPMPFGQLPLVRLTGYTYDVYMAAADLLDFEAATHSLEFDFSTNQHRFQRSQNMEMLIKLASMYKTQARPQPAQIYRQDQQDASYLPPNQFL